MSNSIKFKATFKRKQSLPWVVIPMLGAAIAALPGAAQEISRGGTQSLPVLAITYDIERAKLAAAGGGGFWLQGGGIDADAPFYKGLGVAASFQGGLASNIQPGVNLSKLSYLAGPRYTRNYGRFQVFGEGLFGGTHGFNGIFPANGAVTSTANSYGMQFGGGLDIWLAHGFGMRALELDYVRTGLPNNGANSQNDLRLGFGLSYRFRRK